MSMLLDALRKSEKRQRAHEAADIFSSSDGLEDSPGLSGRRAWVVMTVAGMAVVLAAVVWYLRWDTERSALEAATASGSQQAATQGVEPLQASTADTSSPQAAASAGLGAANAQAGPSRRAQAATPVERLAPAAPSGKQNTAQADNAGGKNAPNKASAAGGAGKTPEEIKAAREAKRKAEREAKRKAQRKAERQARLRAEKAAAGGNRSNVASDAAATQSRASEGNSAKPAARAPEAEKSAPSAPPQPQQRAAPEPISYWELPENVRNQLPPMKITVLVYAQEPNERFVLMDGQRLSHHQELESGLFLREIRRDGAVMTFRKYRFLVKHN